MHPYLKKFSVKKITREQSLAEQIWRSFDKKISFGLLMAQIKRKGYQFVFESWKEAKEGKEPVKLFMYKLGKTHIDFSPKI